MIIYYAHPERGRQWVADLWGKCPAFVCVLGFTATALIEGISSAGQTPEARKYTAIADGELLATGEAVHLPQLAAGVSPAWITRAIVAELAYPLYIFNAGLLTTPPYPHIDLGGAPAECVTTGHALGLATVRHLFEQGLAWGEKLGKQYPYLILSECVVAGTTTALAVLTGLGISANDLVGSSHHTCNHAQKWAIVQQGLSHSRARHPLDLISAVGDPMQIVLGGMTIAASRHTKVLLAGGSQMLAVYALACALAQSEAQSEQMEWQAHKVAIGTTKWVCHDPSSDLLSLAHRVGAVPILASGLSMADSRFPQLRKYEAGFVKEGVGAGASLISAHLYQNWTQAQMLRAIEQLLQSRLHG